MTPPEVGLWVQVRRQTQGLRFRRQHPVGPFVLDFYCDSVKLAVEVDGQRHWLGDAQFHDIERDAWLATRGIHVLRLSATLVFQDMDTAVRAVLYAAGQTDSPHP